MGCSWIAEDIADRTGTSVVPVIPARDSVAYRTMFPSSSYDDHYSSSYSSKPAAHTESIYRTITTAYLCKLSAEKKAEGQHSQLKKLAHEASMRLKESKACELLLLSIELDQEITSGTLHRVVSQLTQYFREVKDSCYRLQQEISNDEISYDHNPDDYEPSTHDLDEALLLAIYSHTSARIMTYADCGDPFWRIKDDLSKINIKLHSTANISDLFESLCCLRKSYVKCDNCGHNMLSAATGKIFPFCMHCNQRRES